MAGRNGNMISNNPPPPLGVRLPINAPLLQSLEEKLNGAAQILTPPANNNDEKKLKAEHFPVHRLEIGSYKVETEYAAHLVAKFYYSGKKLVWEILDNNGLKKKIEIRYQSIVAIRAVVTEDNKSGILAIELGEVPHFYCETELTAKKHTKWHSCHDFFPRRQASRYRRHYLQFHPGVLDKHYMNLLCNNHQLWELSQRPFPGLQSRYFDSHFSNGHVLHASSQNPHVLPPEPLQQFGNNGTISSTSDIYFLTNEAINNPILPGTSLDAGSSETCYENSFSTESAPGSLASEYQPPLELSEIPNEQVQLFGNANPLNTKATNDQISPYSDICYPENETIDNQMLQYPNSAAWNQGLPYETLFSTEFYVPQARQLQPTGPVPNYEQPSHINGMLPPNYNVPETVFNPRHVRNSSGLSREAASAYNTNTSTQIYQPNNASENSWNAPIDGWEQQYDAGDANLNPMRVTRFDDHFPPNQNSSYMSHYWRDR